MIQAVNLLDLVVIEINQSVVLSFGMLFLYNIACCHFVPILFCWYNSYFLLLYCFGFLKADSGKRGDSDSSSILRSAEEELDDDECLGQVPEASWAVPQVPSPPTASGLYWPKNPQNQYDSAFVPDIHHHSQLNRTATRRRLQ